MILIAENLNIVSKTIGPAFKSRQAGPVQDVTRTIISKDIDYLDINIGPARKDGAELMAWVVQTVQEVTDKPLSLDTTNLQAMESGLEVCKGKALVNSISLEPYRLEQGLPLVKKYQADMVGLLWGVEGMPRDANERCLLAVDLVYQANMQGIPNENIWIDPIATPVSGEINQLKACFEFMSMLPEVAPGCKSIIGLSNISAGTPSALRPYLNRTFMIMLMKYGLFSAIMDAFDNELIEIARGRRPELVQMVHRMMEGESPRMEELTPEEKKYAKTVRVLTGESLYSHSWLEI